MPARIDPDRRRMHVVDAAFRLVAAEGIAGLTLRKVAAEAGLNIGSVRHYFDGHDDLVAAAATEAGRRMGERLARHPAHALRAAGGTDSSDASDPVDALQALLEEVLPVDDERAAEATVVLEFIIASRTRRDLAGTAARMAADLHDVAVDALAALGVPDPDGEARRLTALIGGLTLDAVTPHGALGVPQLRAVLRAHLRTLPIPGTRA